MPNRHINANIHKTISPATGVDISQDITARRTLASSLQSANTKVVPPSLYTLSNNLHNTVSAVIAMLESSRPRRLRLARSLSSRFIFVGVLLILMSLLIKEPLLGR